MAATNAYVRRFLVKGVPSLFSDLKPLYNQPGKAELLEGLFERLLQSLKDTGSFPALASTQAAGDKDAEPSGGDAADSSITSTSADGETPQAELWTMFYLAQHYDRMGRTGDDRQTS